MGGLLLATTLGATQPNQVYDYQRCHAAYQANDNEAILTGCRAEAEDYLVDAQNETGELKAESLLVAVTALGMVAFAQKLLGDDEGGNVTLRHMRSLLVDAHQYIVSPSTLSEWQHVSNMLSDEGY